MKNSISSITLLLISLLGVSCVGNKKTGVSVYQDKGQPYADPYASSNDFYNQPVGDPYVPPTSGDFGIEPPSSATSYSPQPTYTPPPSKSVHTVSKGDTLYSISRNYGTTVAALRQANGINGSLIRIGERIMIP